MIQSALFFILGVLVAVFVVILLGPSVWRRAFFLARRQVQSELPITLAEIRADRDGLRAEHAVAVCKVEQQLKLERQKIAAQEVVVGRQYEMLKRIPQLEEELIRVGKQLADHEKTTRDAETEKAVVVEKAEIVQAELERLQRHFITLEGLADTLRIEITGNEAENGRLTNEITEMRRDRKEATSRYNELSTQLTSAQTELKSEKRRNNELQHKLEKLISELSDAQEKLERCTRNGTLVLPDSSVSASLAKDNAVLREEMAALAARVVAATAEREGPDSPINAILNAEGPSASGLKAAGTAGNIVSKKGSAKSLARRIRDLQ